LITGAQALGAAILFRRPTSSIALPLLPRHSQQLGRLNVESFRKPTDDFQAGVLPPSRRPHREQTSLAAQSGTDVSAPYHSAISPGSGST
jgi:hypothetical protein